MTRKTMLALLTQADTTLPDNVSGDISPADVRDMVKDIIDSFSPGYGAASNAAVTLVALGATPVVVPYATLLAQTVEYVVTVLAGTIQRLAGGLPTTVNRLSFYADVAAATGAEVQFSLYRNGLAVPGADTTVSGQGAGNFVQASFSIGLTSIDGADYTYEVRAAKITGAADNVGLSNARFIVELVPTIGI